LHCRVSLLAVLLALALLLSAGAYAEVLLVEPAVATLQDGSIFALGAMQPGDVVELVVSKRTGIPGVDWDLVSVQLPKDWAVASQEETEATIITRLKTSKLIEENIYNLRIGLSSNSAGIQPESADLRIQIKKGLVDVSINELSRQAVVGEPLDYNVTVNNRSIAQQKLRLSSELSPTWLMPFDVIVPPKQKITKQFTVMPRVDGVRSFRFFVDSEQQRVAEFYSVLDVRPTVDSKYTASLYGFPFFTFALAPFQALASVLWALLT
jgi:hypothetical protein